MSAFIVSKKTIDALVTFLFKRIDLNNLPEDKGLNQIGQILINENYRSVNYRYDDNELPFKYKFNQCLVSDIQILCLCNCYNYQSCETDYYKKTKAAKLINIIREVASEAFPENYEHLPEYLNSEWDLR